MTITPTRNTLLYRCSCTQVTLINALSALENDWIGLVYTPNWAGLVRYSSGKNLYSPDHEVKPDQVFEARFFNENQELRWLRNPVSNGIGDSICLSEKELTLTGWQTMTPLADLEPLNGQYLIAGWGCSSGGSPEEGWSQVTNASIGTRTIPFGGLLENGRCYLRYREYLGRPPVGDAGVDGNCVIREERLLGLSSAISETTMKNDIRN